MPTSANHAFFDGNGTGNCLLDQDGDTADLTLGAGYTGRFDMITWDLTCTGDVALNDGGIFDMGTGTWELQGDFDFSAHTLAKFDDGTSTLLLNPVGGDKTVTASGGALGDRWFYNIAVNSSGGNKITLASGRGFAANLVSTITTELEVSSGVIFYGSVLAANTLVINGTLSGLGTCAAFVRNGTQPITHNGTVTIALFRYVVIVGHTTGVITSGRYQGDLWISNSSAGDCTCIMESGIFTVDGDFVAGNLHSGFTTTIDCATQNPSFVFRTDVDMSLGGTTLWQRGTGVISLEGSASISQIDFAGNSIEDLEIDKSSTARSRFIAAWDADSFNAISGIVHWTVFTYSTTGNFTMGIGSSGYVTNMNGVTWDIGGNLSLSGESGDLLTFPATAAWYINLTGTGVATYVDVKYSDADGGNFIVANDGTSVDGGNNPNWYFPSPSPSISVSPLSPSISISPLSPSMSDSGTLEITKFGVEVLGYRRDKPEDNRYCSLSVEPDWGADGWEG